MTEDEAKSKWCPFVRRPLEDLEGQVTTGTPVINRRASGAADNGCLCIASACMAWRGKPVVDFTQAKAYAAQDMRINAIKALRVVLPDLNLKEAKDIVCGDAPWPSNEGGFCGLAGAPQ